MRRTINRPAHRRARSIRIRVIAIAFIPIMAMMLIGFGCSGYLVKQGLHTQDFADVHRDGIPITSAYVADLEQERALTMTFLAGHAAVHDQLVMDRQKVDADIGALSAWTVRVARYAPQTGAQVTQMKQAAAALQRVRAGLDAGQVKAMDAFAFYNQMLGALVVGAKRFALVANNAQVAFENVVAADLFSFIESVAQAHALGIYVQAKRDPAGATQFAVLTAAYRQPPTQLIVNLTQPEQVRFGRLLRSPEWTSLLAGDAGLSAGRKFDTGAWDQAYTAVLNDMTGLYLSHATYKSNLAEKDARDTLTLSWSVAGGVAVLTLLVMAISLRLTSRLISRLRRLQEQTLRLADQDLPALMARISSGDRTDLASAVPNLDVGRDELGEVAEAFGKAQRAAVAAAVAEADTRQGVRTVFLNIAHRSQAIVHRQLEELDQIERSEDNPDLLDRVFRLDHLTTRTRRNAENLIILCGEQVGRQWRHPVSLRDVIQGAVSETKDYTRVTVEAVPDFFVDGSAVADVGHLLAELVDNGTSFSPPESHVAVRAGIAGKGVVVEVEDRGLGIKPNLLAELNELLRQPPDFSLMALAGDVRIGLFVVARLAAKYGIRVSLRESVYGGVHAVMLLPATVLAGERTKPRMPPPPAAPMASAAPAASRVQAQGGPLQWGQHVPAAPLPQRLAQDNLNPQLREAVRPEARVLFDVETRERSARALSAFQRGTAQARAEATTSSGQQGERPR